MLMRSLANRKDINLKIGCLLIGFYITYNVFLVQLGFFVPRLSVITLFLAGVFTFSSTQIRLTREYRYLLVFIIYAFATGVLIAQNSDVVIHQTEFFVESVIAGIIVFNVVTDTERLSWLTGMFAIGALLCTLYFFRRPDLLMETRLSFDEEFNSNTLGVMLTYGVWCIIFTLNYKQTSLIRIVSTIVLVLVVFYILVQTGSRKSVLGSLLMFVLFLIYILFFGEGEKIKLLYKFFIVGAIIGLFFFVYIRYIDVFLEAADTFLFRMENIDSSEEDRGAIIKDSFRVWTDHPLFGVGLDNVRYYTVSKLYSHNSYVEVLACTGIIGAALVYTIFWRMIAFLYKSIRGFKSVMNEASAFYIAILILFYLLVCVVQINIYNQTHMFMTYFILSFIALFAKKNEKYNREFV